MDNLNSRTEPAGSAEPTVKESFTVRGSAGKVELTPLPEPAVKPYGLIGKDGAYTADQMREYALAALSTQSTHQQNVSKSSVEIDMSELDAFEQLLRQVEFVVSVTGPLSRQQSEVWPELKAKAEKARAALSQAQMAQSGDPAQFSMALLDWNRAQEKPPIAIGSEYYVASGIMALLAAQGGKEGE